MIILGLLLLVLAVIFGADLVWQNHFNIAQVKVFGFDLGLGNSAALFIVGAIVGAAIMLGITLLIAGLGRKGSRAVHERERHAEHDRVREENERLRANLAERETSPRQNVVTRQEREPVSRPGVVREERDVSDRPGAVRDDASD